jgi:hypothetical protein
MMRGIEGASPLSVTDRDLRRASRARQIAPFPSNARPKPNLRSVSRSFTANVGGLTVVPSRSLLVVLVGSQACGLVLPVLTAAALGLAQSAGVPATVTGVAVVVVQRPTGGVTRYRAR